MTDFCGRGARRGRLPDAMAVDMGRMNDARGLYWAMLQWAMTANVGERAWVRDCIAVQVLWMAIGEM